MIYTKLPTGFVTRLTLAFHSCDDSLLFEWWDNQEIWLGQRDFNTLRWVNGKFCLGDASNVSFSEKYEFATLLELIEGCVVDIEEADYFGRKDAGS